MPLPLCCCGLYWPAHAAPVPPRPPLASKITVITSTHDRALALSRLLAGGMTRVGEAEQAQLKRLGLHVIDASKQGWGIINHDLFLSNAQIRQVIRSAIDGRPSGGA